ncbi:transporter [Sphingobacteriales bacterium UPWRP_1]|nr:hypothetical protein BVG80_03355 [Sphingobacteriales bacterium TSM_CSM]PSJ75603.1 transporter [Sphingobacteriales bacterium UPWRP_1]
MATITVLFLISPGVLSQPISPDASYLSLQWQQQRFEGLTTYLLFHDNSSNLPYHQHFFYDPFGNSVETFTQISAQARYFLNRRTFVQANLPFALNRRITADTLNMKQNGLADITLGGGYQLYNSLLFNPAARVQHLLTLQAGVQLPSGDFERFSNINEVEPHSMPGTGSVNFAFSGSYRLQLKALQIQTSGSYNLNRKNKYTYRFGNIMQVNLQIQYRQPLFKNIALVPQTGICWLNRYQDYMNNIPTPEYTRAQWLLLNPALGIQAGSVQLQAAWLKPVWSKITGPQPTLKGQWLVNLLYLLPQPKRWQTPAPAKPLRN